MASGDTTSWQFSDDASMHMFSVQTNLVLDNDRCKLVHYSNSNELSSNFHSCSRTSTINLSKQLRKSSVVELLLNFRMFVWKEIDEKCPAQTPWPLSYWMQVLYVLSKSTTGARIPNEWNSVSRAKSKHRTTVMSADCALSKIGNFDSQ